MKVYYFSNHHSMLYHSKYQVIIHYFYTYELNCN